MHTSSQEESNPISGVRKTKHPTADPLSIWQKGSGLPEKSEV